MPQNKKEKGTKRTAKEDVIGYLEKKTKGEEELKREELSIRREELELEKRKVALQEQKQEAERKERENRAEMELQERGLILQALKGKLGLN